MTVNNFNILFFTHKILNIKFTLNKLKPVELLGEPSPRTASNYAPEESGFSLPESDPYNKCTSFLL